MSAPLALEVTDLHRSFGDRAALAGVSFQVGRGETFALLGPNGGGKTTLFRILATLLRPDGGSARVFGVPLAESPAQARRRLGVVFQQPGIDPKLTCAENLIHHGRLFGMRGAALRAGVAAQLERFGLAARAREMAETLSGGMQRRLELAKALLPGPDLLLLDEPTAGLDPAARRDFGGELDRLRRERGTTVVLTTHLMDEAERCDRVGILHEGRLVALGTPEGLKREAGEEVIFIRADDPASLREKLRARFGWEAMEVDEGLRVERPGAHALLPQVIEAFGAEVRSVTFGRPTLEDVFIRRTGRRFGAPPQEGAA
ncbi:MAG: ABC transporter ATP-binding protein [Candidatus Tectomicrobia bacterium]|uniref:ABC transporter ATP-binding protein n=1 Tax=Tectimicrobiota bacterium TaxID=2528274 RepID=A0A932HY66_UNCTE|nr:ABC transporter ATP-binding protein [Candidatus Tectomicrobia bacterium]